MERTIIGLSGPAGAGKTYAAHILHNVLNEKASGGFFKVDSFAAPLKAFVLDLVGEKFPLDKDADYPLFPGTTYREVLQRIGTEVMRDSLDKDIWIRSLDVRNENQNVIIDDVRFENEVDWIHSKGGIVLRIEPAEGSVVKGQVWRSHASENGDIKADATVYNPFTTSLREELIKAVVLTRQPAPVPPMVTGHIEDFVNTWMQNFRVFEGKPREESVLMYEKLLREELNELSMENVGTENFYREVLDVVWVAIGIALASGMTPEQLRKGMNNLYLANSAKCCAVREHAEKYAESNGGTEIKTTLEGNYMVLNKDGKIMKGPFHRKMQLPDGLV